jgi:hypothetical protein
MDHTRRNFPFVLAFVLLGLASLFVFTAAPGPASAQQGRPQTSTNPFPSAFPNDPNFGPSPVPSGPLAENNPGPILRQNQLEMRRDVEQLATMAQQLQQQVNKTNSTQVLSIALVDKAKKIEDLAKKIKNLASGS